MSTLDDLRETLLAHREDVDDTGAHLRSAAVHQRVRAVRRRRTAVASVAAVVVLVGGVAGVSGLRLDPTPDVAGPVVLGLDVPQELRLDGFPYELVDADGVAPGERVDLPDDQEQRAVTLVARDLGEGTATLLADGEPVARVLDDGLSAPSLVHGPARLQVRLDGADESTRVSVALYAATGGLAPGVTDGTAVFRDEVAGEPLLAGAFSEPGVAEVELSVTGALGDLRFTDHCRGVGDDAVLHVEVDGEGWSSGGCDDGPDAGRGGTWAHTDDRPAEHTVRAWVTDGPDGPLVESADVVVGVAAYERRPAEVQALGEDVAEVVEHDGRRWELDEVRRQPEPGEPFTTQVEADEDVLLGLVSQGDRVHLRWSGGRDRGESTRYTGEGSVGPGTGVDTLLLAGERYDVAVLSDGDAPFRAAVLVYRPL
ncbi:hypothetical protein [Nocardioides deserti]|uniref:DUF4179 domain-containing protein n=1 Tax=Nocardioides deserti TaxID=1588644 RepID=A0ABR6U9Q4_9ACTN|nr:hypothetical protein [Nocardioides deserti]MBC2961108.1 hypothetical protein [Nocardioides deserti]GGO76390.1 hypothetical protein GCM10012276_29020 [Nocardioides deserti]